MKKVFLAVFVVLIGVFFAVYAGIRSDNNYPVTKFEEVKPEVGPDGRAAVGSPETYKIGISPALALKKADGPAKTFVVIGIILLIFAAAYMTLAELGIIKGNIHHAFVALALSFASCMAAYSSRFVSNYVEVGKERYEVIKNNKDSLENLFNKKILK